MNNFSIQNDESSSMGGKINRTNYKNSNFKFRT